MILSFISNVDAEQHPTVKSLAAMVKQQLAPHTSLWLYLKSCAELPPQHHQETTHCQRWLLICPQKPMSEALRDQDHLASKTYTANQHQVPFQRHQPPCYASC